MVKFDTKYIAAVVLFLFILVSLVLIFQTNFLKVKSVSCKTQYGHCDLNDEKVLSKIQGQNLFFADIGNLKTELAQNFRNRNIFIQRVFPNRVSVFLEKRKSQVAFKLADSQTPGFFVVDEDGVVLGKVADTPLPTITLNSQGDTLVVGERLTERAKNAANLVYTTFRSQGKADGLLEDGFISVSIANDITVYYPLDGDPSVLVGALQLILNRSKIDNQLPKSIDLRYSNPVLRY